MFTRLRQLQSCSIAKDSPQTWLADLPQYDSTICKILKSGTRT